MDWSRLQEPDTVKIDEILQKKVFNKSIGELALYIKVINDELIVASLYVDNFLVIGSNAELVKQFKVKIMQAFEVTNLGEMTFFLGLKIQQS